MSQAYVRSHMRSSFSSAISTSRRSKLGTSACRLWRPCSPKGWSSTGFSTQPSAPHDRKEDKEQQRHASKLFYICLLPLSLQLVVHAALDVKTGSILFKIDKRTRCEKEFEKLGQCLHYRLSVFDCLHGTPWWCLHLSAPITAFPENRRLYTSVRHECASGIVMIMTEQQNTKYHLLMLGSKVVYSECRSAYSQISKIAKSSFYYCKGAGPSHQKSIPLLLSHD